MSTETIPEQTDYPSLALGYPPTSCTSVNIVGLDVKVYGLKEVGNSSLPLAAIVSPTSLLDAQQAVFERNIHERKTRLKCR